MVFLCWFCEFYTWRTRSLNVLLRPHLKFTVKNRQGNFHNGKWEQRGDRPSVSAGWKAGKITPFWKTKKTEKIKILFVGGEIIMRERHVSDGAWVRRKRSALITCTAVSPSLPPSSFIIIIIFFFLWRTQNIFSRSGRFSLSSIWLFTRRKKNNNKKECGPTFFSSSSNKAVIVSDVFTRLGFHRLRREYRVTNLPCVCVLLCRLLCYL